jgi:hypothetical protein
VKTKFDVHWAPAVNVITPGWIFACPAGAQADAAGANSTTRNPKAIPSQIEKKRRLISPPSP